MRQVAPIRERTIDYLFVGFFLLNLLFISTVVDIEQLVIDDPNDFDYPLWPPKRLVDLIHWYGSNFDPPLMAREDWWRATIWIDQLFFVPFYAVATYQPVDLLARALCALSTHSAAIGSRSKILGISSARRRTTVPTQHPTHSAPVS